MIETTAAKQQIISYLAFALGREHFALNVGSVINILEMQSITKVPRAPDYMTGMINLRGDVLPVIDTKIKLGLGPTKPTNNTCILVVESFIAAQSVRFGILVDSVQKVLELSDEKILPSPAIGNKYRTELISGVVEEEDKFLMIIDINTLLGINEVLDLKNLSK